MLGRYGLADDSNDAFYQGLESELNEILGTGLDRIRGELERTMQARLSARADTQFQALSAPRDRQLADDPSGGKQSRDN